MRCALAERIGRMQLKVIKSDGSTERYLHTKVLGTFSNALGLIGQSNVYAAEQFAEALTFHLYEEKQPRKVTSDSIHLMVRAVLVATGYENAAEALNDYRLRRQLERSRIEVIDDPPHQPQPDSQRTAHRWNKSIIARHLIDRDGMDYHMARAIATSVEEKILSLGITSIRKSLIRELLASQTEVMLRAYKQLQGTA